MRTQRWCFPTSVKRFLRDESATTAIEYAMIASVISIAILSSVAAVGSALLTNFYDKITAAFDEAAQN